MRKKGVNMKRQITRLAPHQNAKVFAVLFAISSAIFLTPFSIIFMVSGPKGSGATFAPFVFLPFIYLVVGYLTAIFGAWLYNKLFPYIGGFEVNVE
jgi:hypothetical protein